MRIIVVSVQLVPSFIFVCVLMSMRDMFTGIWPSGTCWLQLFVSRSVPCLPDSLLTGDWVETGKFTVVAVCRLEEHSLVSLR